MSLADRKITSFVQPVTSLADKPQITAAELKAAFDSNSNELRPALNGIIDDLMSNSGASDIYTEAGISVEDALHTLVKYESDDIKFIRINADGAIEVSANGTQWNSTSSSKLFIYSAFVRRFLLFTTNFAPPRPGRSDSNTHSKASL